MIPKTKSKGWKNRNATGHTPAHESWRHGQARKGIKTGRNLGRFSTTISERCLLSGHNLGKHIKGCPDYRGDKTGEKSDEVMRRMSIENIRKASLSLAPSKRKRYVDFMTKRFGVEYTALSYAEEWADRLKGSNPEKYMDSKSTKVWNDINESNKENWLDPEDWQYSESFRRELNRGIEVEHEHTTDNKIAKKIALDHLKEDPHYYSKLAIMEKPNGDADKDGVKNKDDCQPLNPKKQDDPVGATPYLETYTEQQSDREKDFGQFKKAGVETYGEQKKSKLQELREKIALEKSKAEYDRMTSGRPKEEGFMSSKEKERHRKLEEKALKQELYELKHPKLASAEKKALQFAKEQDIKLGVWWREKGSPALKEKAKSGVEKTAQFLRDTARADFRDETKPVRLFKHGTKPVYGKPYATYTEQGEIGMKGYKIRKHKHKRKHPEDTQGFLKNIFG